MYKNPDILWLNTNPYLLRFNLPIIKYLSQYVSIGQWEYEITEDEGACLNNAIALLDSYLEMIKKPVHLIGHSTCGMLGLEYAQRYPEKVKSLTVLGVGINPSLDWVSYYYLLRNNFNCSQDVTLAHVAKYLFGYRNSYYQKSLVKIIHKALFYSLSPHSLYKKYSYSSIETLKTPLMICGSVHDKIVFWSEVKKWKNYLKPQDALWQCPEGEHFFHYFEPKLVGGKIVNFLSGLSLNYSNHYESVIKNFT